MVSNKIIWSLIGVAVVLAFTGTGLGIYYLTQESDSDFEYEYELANDFLDETNTTSIPGNGQRTIIFFHKAKFRDSVLFIRGGLDKNDCTEPAETDACSIPFTINKIGDTLNYDMYNDWMIGDDFLDWYGEESGQNYHKGEPASGTNLAWTTNETGVDGFHFMNTFGEDYYMLDFMMDCSLTEDTWFEFKGYLANADIYTGWELDINQGICTGSAGLPVPFDSNMHMARCGYMNVFRWDAAACTIDEIPEEMTTTEEPPTTDIPVYDRTIILLHKEKLDKEDVFIRGGIHREPCSGQPAEADNCSLPFYINIIGNTANFDPYNSWMIGDDYLDWWGEEEGQGYYLGTPASGSYLAWTTNDTEVDGYNEINIYGEDYWMIDFDMDCSLTDNGWFEFRGWLANADIYTGWELDINQGICEGSEGMDVPFDSDNHVARCGYLNIFGWNEGSCITEPIPSVTTDYTTDHSSTDYYSSTDNPSSPPTSNGTKTVIFFHKKVYEEQYVFIRGGLDEDSNSECNGPPVETDACALPFAIDSLGETDNYIKYNYWREGDDHLDWFGEESGQGYYQGEAASGTPLAWTTNKLGVDGYQELNTYGEDYWMIQFEMDCSLTDNGWFQMKGWLANAGGYTGWELDIHQGTCTGSAGTTPPYSATNHVIRCGYINVFEWNEGSCIIEPMVDTY